MLRRWIYPDFSLYRAQNPAGVNGRVQVVLEIGYSGRLFDRPPHAVCMVTSLLVSAAARAACRCQRAAANVPPPLGSLSRKRAGRPAFMSLQKPGSQQSAGSRPVVGR